jgi:hypothetical protein
VIATWNARLAEAVERLRLELIEHPPERALCYREVALATGGLPIITELSGAALVLTPTGSILSCDSEDDSVKEIVDTKWQRLVLVVQPNVSRTPGACSATDDAATAPCARGAEASGGEHLWKVLRNRLACLIVDIEQGNIECRARGPFRSSRGWRQPPSRLQGRMPLFRWARLRRTGAGE